MAARKFSIPAAARSYHLAAMTGNRICVLTGWALNAITTPAAASFGLTGPVSVALDVDSPPADRTQGSHP